MKVLLHWKKKLKIVLLFGTVFGLVVSVFMQINLSLNQTSKSLKDDVFLDSDKILYDDLDVKRTKIKALEEHLNELNAIKLKALTFLTQLDKKRAGLLDQITEKSRTSDRISVQIKERNRELQKIKTMNDPRSQKILVNLVYVGLPKKTNFNISFPPQTQHVENGCNYKTCFDYSRCSSIKNFTFSVHDKDNPLYSLLEKETDFTTDSKVSCITIHHFKFSTTNNYETFSKSLHELKPNNLLLVEPGDDQSMKIFCETIYKRNPGVVILILPWLCKGYRSRFDYILPPDLPFIQENIWKFLPKLVPLKRRYLLTFSYEFLPYSGNITDHDLSKDILKLFGEKDIDITTKCLVSHKRCTAGWCMCQEGTKLLHSSKFTILPSDETNAMLFQNLIDILKAGCVPVIIGDIDLLPFSSTIDWQTAAIILPSQRLPELTFMLRSLSAENLINLKKQGKFFYERYLTSKAVIFRTMISNLQANINLPPTRYQEVKAVHIKVIGSAMEKNPLTQKQHDFSYIGLNRFNKWNTYPGAKYMIPLDPWLEPPPTEYQFIDEGKDAFMPIGDGKGGDGVPFSRSQGGDYPMELFTVVMLTYDRPNILVEALQRLSGLKYLHKIVVIWNHPIGPDSKMAWPNVDVNIEIIKGVENSLNNRFKPYDIIETECILSLDDDVYLRHDEIDFAFRVWRQNRDRIVGFPGRNHPYNATSKSFIYGYDHTCELSIILTGGAFIHKYYSYIYTYVMEKSIRDMVDSYMNCEDLAMNFLVSHVTGKPPIKVTSRWTFRCPGCPVALSASSDHYTERSNCMERLGNYFGYVPLRRTQFRADSVLFKTRVSRKESKCYDYV